MFNRPKQTKIVAIGLDDFDLFGITLPNQPVKGILPITFVDSQECLDMLLDKNTEQEDQAEANDLLEKVEMHNGKLELRLSFFTNTFKWQ